MKKTIQAVLVAAALTIPAAGSVAAQDHAATASMGQSMLIGALTNSLNRAGIPTTNLNKLTLDEAIELSVILGSTQDDERTIRQRAETLLDAAGDR
ncbi:MAG: hypothetical protein AAGH83_05080 [Pseudomonadota bacterium]